MNTKSGTWRYITQIVQSLWQGTRGKLWWMVAAGIVLLTAVVLYVGYKSAPTAGTTSAVSASGALATATSSTTGGGAGQQSATAASLPPQQSPTTANGPAQASPTHTSQAQAIKSAASPQEGQRLVIETANLDLKVSNLPKIGSQISQMTTQAGGFVQSMQQSTEQQGKSLESLTIRIPESQFQSVLGKVKSLGIVSNFSQTGEDVTSQHNNLQQQLAQLQSEAQAYTRLFNKATSMSDMLQIQQSLTQVNSQIANINNQLHNLNRSVQLATLNITLQSSVIPIHQGSAPIWSPFVQSIHFMKRVGEGLLRVIAWVLPWVVLVGLVIGGVRFIRRRFHKGAGN